MDAHETRIPCKVLREIYVTVSPQSVKFAFRTNFVTGTVFCCFCFIAIVFYKFHIYIYIVYLYIYMHAYVYVYFNNVNNIFHFSKCSNTLHIKLLSLKKKKEEYRILVIRKRCVPISAQEMQRHEEGREGGEGMSWKISPQYLVEVADVSLELSHCRAMRSFNR